MYSIDNRRWDQEAFTQATVVVEKAIQDRGLVKQSFDQALSAEWT
ncbi:MAG: hypothetical protein QW304_08680 [Thermoproteota archaeon]